MPKGRHAGATLGQALGALQELATPIGGGGRFEGQGTVDQQAQAHPRQFRRAARPVATDLR
jgi:hypothetical protein